MDARDEAKGLAIWATVTSPGARFFGVQDLFRQVGATYHHQSSLLGFGADALQPCRLISRASARSYARGKSKDLFGAELSYALSALGPSRWWILRNACVERLSATDRVGPSGGGRRN